MTNEYEEMSTAWEKWQIGAVKVYLREVEMTLLLDALDALEQRDKTRHKTRHKDVDSPGFAAGAKLVIALHKLRRKSS